MRSLPSCASIDSTEDTAPSDSRSWRAISRGLIGPNRSSHERTSPSISLHQPSMFHPSPMFRLVHHSRLDGDQHPMKIFSSRGADRAERYGSVPACLLFWL